MHYRWNYLEIQTSHKEDDSIQAYAAGLLEGSVTANLINIYWKNIFQNFCNDRADLCEKLTVYLQTNKNWVMSQILEKNGTDAYWHQVSNLLLFKCLIINYLCIINIYCYKYHKTYNLCLICYKYRLD